MRGHVVDFLQLPSFPIFNVADICINIAAALIILQALRGIARRRPPHSDESASSSSEAGEPSLVTGTAWTGPASRSTAP